MPPAENLPSVFTLVIIGCGKLGFAVLQGLLGPLPNQPVAPCSVLPKLGRIIVSVRTPEKAQILLKVLSHHIDDNTCPLELVVGNNVEAALKADVVILGCHPSQAIEVLGVRGMAEALAGKLLLSMLGGVSVSALEKAILPKASPSTMTPQACHIMQAIPNIAASHKKSVTIVGERSASIPHEIQQLGMIVLEQIGDIIMVDSHQMPAATAVCASSTAFFAVFLGAIIEGAVREGLDRSMATRMAGLAMAGAAKLVVSGQDPAAVEDQVTTPGGATAAGIAILAQNGTSEVAIKALHATTSRIGAHSSFVVDKT